jgi:hypothetical protein
LVDLVNEGNNVVGMEWETARKYLSVIGIGTAEGKRESKEEDEGRQTYIFPSISLPANAKSHNCFSHSKGEPAKHPVRNSIYRTRFRFRVSHDQKKRMSSKRA